MRDLCSRVEALEKIIADRVPVAPVQFIILDIGRDDPEAYRRKQQRIAEIEATGEKVIVYSVVGAGVKNGAA